MYNVVATNYAGEVKRGIVDTIADILISATFSAEVARHMYQCDIVLTSMMTKPDESTIDLVYSLSDGTVFMTVTGVQINVDDSNAPDGDQMPKVVTDAVDNILKSIMKA